MLTYKNRARFFPHLYIPLQIVPIVSVTILLSGCATIYSQAHPKEQPRIREYMVVQLWMPNSWAMILDHM